MDVNYEGDDCGVESFKKCGISNAMDGTDDDFIYESDDENSSDAESDFYVEEATGWDLIELFGDSDSD